MYLKSIEMQGFKSFANKIRFDFKQGITGIVGPNGSGKSNVADAVRWVLGEQSAKQLRGAKMEDVIFAGTQNRRPLGFANVVITFDNSDHVLPIEYDEVAVSRRVYRSGESEYKINGNACRLKDIQELFYDTGIGQEGYSIIGQGQIDRILSGKPEERRELFDEAAGIVKFKRRKAEAVKKLEKEQDSLTRVDDILLELEKQTGPLKEESEKAKEYLALRDRLKKYDVNSFLLQSDQIRKDTAENETKLSQANGQLSDAKEQLEKTKAEYESAEEQIAGLEQSIAEAEKNKTETEVSLERLAGSKKLTGQQLENLHKELSAAQKAHEDAASRLSQLKEEKEGLNAQSEELEASVSEYKVSQAQLEQKQNDAQTLIRETEQQIEANSAKIIEGLSRASEESAAVREQETLKSQYGIRKATLQNRILQRKSQEKEQSGVVRSFEKELADLKEEDAQVTRQLEQASQKNEELHRQEQAERQEGSRLQSEYHRERSRAEALSAIAERYDGYGNAVRRVMQVRNDHPGICGVVADLIKTDKRYETAIETALGGAIQNVVTDTEGTAKELIRFLKETKAGRATFLPLSALTVRGTLEGSPALREPGAIGIASGLVNFEPKYQILAQYLLGRVLIADTIDNALVIERKYHHSLRIVTLEGDQLNPGGSMTGGAFRHAGNLLARRREIEMAKERVKELTQLLDELDSKSKERQETQAALKRTISELTVRSQTIKLDANTAQLNLRQASEKKAEIVSGYSGNGDEVRELTKKIAAIDELLTKKKDTLQRLQEEDAQLKEQSEQLGKKRQEQETQAESLREEKEKLRLTYSSTLQKEEFLQENTQRLSKEMQEQQRLLDETDKRILEAKEELSKRQDEMEQLSAAELAGNTKQKELTEALSDLNGRHEAMRTKNKSFFDKREAISSEMTAMEKEVLRLSSRKEKLEDSLNTLSEYMWNEYELTYSSAVSMRDPSLTSAAALKKDIAECKSGIRELGAVNVNAIAQYKEVSERYDFMKGQHDDLVKAADSLQKVITDLDEGMRRQFREKFRIIQAEFDRVFKELFGGGNGTLLLDESEDILEAGITVVSQPPGKKLQNMMQLSGGEKALTAIALLFAIQSLKPSPFCLLDEIEAALDDANVVRFAEYLHHLTKHTQFIVITHRRGTMNAADRLYGITMQEKGVSTLVSVDLISDKLEEEETKRQA